MRAGFFFISIFPSLLIAKDIHVSKTGNDSNTGKSSGPFLTIGQYAYGNEPSHHIAYLYAFAGQQWKTAEKVRQIMKDFYHDDLNGVIGNEDAGQMSAWYVFSSLGFYTVFPAS